MSAAQFANLYKGDNLTGGHVIMLGADPLSQAAAIEALHEYPGTSSIDFCDRDDVFILLKSPVLFSPVNFLTV